LSGNDENLIGDLSLWLISVLSGLFSTLGTDAVDESEVKEEEVFMELVGGVGFRDRFNAVNRNISVEKLSL